MKLFDILFLIDREGKILTVSCRSLSLEALYRPAFSNWISQGACVWEMLGLEPDSGEGDFSWEGERFQFECLPARDGSSYFFMKKQNEREFLLARSLDLMEDGVQIYDKNACAVYVNQASRRISQIPAGMEVEGRHLLDLYEVDEDVSTILTCLKTRAPVVNRVDRFQARSGGPMATANTAYPIRQNKTLIGAVVFEQDGPIAQKGLRQREQTVKALRSCREETPGSRFAGYSFDSIIGNGESLRRAVDIARRIAVQDSTVMLVGETGTGKEIFAQSIHRSSQRSSGRFVALNCAAIPDSLIESLLFGTKKGSFTGSEDKPGYFEEAEGGTLFLDELNSMSLAMQSKILRAIQENTFRRVGSQKDIRMDVRIVSSCNEDPFHAIEAHQLRRDLFYRLSAAMIRLPPLREHKEDLDLLISRRLEQTASQYVCPAFTLSEEVSAILRAYDWPGNVRELFHVLDYARNVTEDSVLRPEALPDYVCHPVRAEDSEEKSKDFHKNPSSHQAGLWQKQKHMVRTNPEGLSPSGCTPGAQEPFSVRPEFFTGQSLQESMDTFECSLLISALNHFGGNVTQTAEALGLRRQSLQYRIRKYGIII